jgi:predicted helicase
VRSVHELLQTEFGLEDGLASTITWGEMIKRNPDLKLPDISDDPKYPKPVPESEYFVQILDPATGTATFLVEAIDVIYNHLKAKWAESGLASMPALPTGTANCNCKLFTDFWNAYVPKALLPRLHGYELLMAPYAIAHMKIGLKLAETKYSFGTEERVRIYLTNALEPWVKQLPLIGFDALAHEAAAVNKIKRDTRFTVVIGNPPYSGISSNMSEFAQRIVDGYKLVDGSALNERKLWLQDDYVKFIRNAQTIIDGTKIGLIGYITNHGYLANPTFRGMRQSLMASFKHLCVLDLHGNSNKKEQSPDGSGDKPVFDIKQGVAICLATRGGRETGVAHAEIWGSRETKYEWLTKHCASDTNFKPLTPDSPFYFFETQNIDCREEYDSGWKINSAMPVNCAGFITARDHFVVALDKETLLERIGDFANLAFSDAEIRERYFEGFGSAKYPDGDSRGWKVPAARKRVAVDKNWRERVRTCLYRPFDPRSIYWATWMVDWPRPEVMRHMFSEHALALSTSRSVEIGTFEHVFCACLPLGHHTVSLKEVNYMFPLYLLPDDDDKSSLVLRSEREPNFAPAFVKAISEALCLPQNEISSLPVGLTPEDIFNYIYAVLHSPTYRTRYAEFLKIDFPRLPLTSSLDLFRALAALGGELVALHLIESPKLDKHITHCVGDQKQGVEKITYSDETVWVDKAKSAGFKGVPENVWNFHIGGYQVCEKWLKDRKGRTLTDDDITHYHKIIVALSETIRLMSEIDIVINTHGGWPGAFAVACNDSVSNSR